MTERVERRLAAVLAADVAGYSRLMGIDEVGTLEALKAYRHETVDPTIEAHNGRIVKTVGDGLLVEFASAVDAVICAMNLQAAMAERIKESAHKIVFRIGINVGDIIVEDGDIFGDGVNVAARVENECEPGEVFISDDVYRQVRGKTDFGFDNLGERTLKNIDRPVRLYAVRAEKTPELTGIQKNIEFKIDQAAPPAANKVLIIVETFEAIGNGLALDFVHALSTDLITELTHYGAVRVFAAPHDAIVGAYRVRGELRGSPERLQVAIRLEDAESAATIWAERFDRQNANMASETVAETLAALVVRQAEREDLRRARLNPLAGLTPRELCLIGRDHHQRGTEADTIVAASMFDQAIAKNSNYAVAHAWQAYTIHRVITHGWGPPIGEQAARERALMHARRAVQLESESPLSLSRLAFALMLHERWDEAVQTARSALQIARAADYVTRNTCCEVLAHGGYPVEAADAVQRPIFIDPHCPPTTRSLLGRALLLGGDPEAALPELQWCAARLPDYAPCFHSVIVAAIETGRNNEARAAVREAIRLQPYWVPKNHTGAWFFRYQRDADRFKAAFRAAGWPEKQLSHDAGDYHSVNVEQHRDEGKPTAWSTQNLRETKPAGTA